MITRISVTSTAWVQIAAPGKDFDAFLVDENTGSGDGADVRVIQAVSLPATSVPAINGRRVTRPRFNTDVAHFESDDSTMYHYARCATNDATAIIAVEMSETITLDRLVDQGKLFFIQTRTPASTATRYLLIRTGAKRLNLLVSIESSGAALVNFVEAPATVTGTSALVSRNFNRNYPDDALLSKIYSVTGYTGGTNISPNQSGFGSIPGRAVSGQTGDPVKYTLKPNTDYIYEVDPVGTTTIDTKARSIEWEDED